MKNITKEEVERQLSKLAAYGVFDEEKGGYKVSNKYKGAWKNALNKLAMMAEKKPRLVGSVNDASVSAHLRALFECGWFVKARSESEIKKAVVIVDSFRKGGGQ